MRKKIEIREFQSLKDLALVNYGSIEGVFNISGINKNLSLTTQLLPNEKVGIDDNFIQKETVDVFSKRKNEPITGIVSGNVGIGNMVIESTFIVG